MSGVSPVTVTVSWRFATLSATSIGTVWPTLTTTALRSNLPKPWSSAVTS